MLQGMKTVRNGPPPKRRRRLLGPGRPRRAARLATPRTRKGRRPRLIAFGPLQRAARREPGTESRRGATPAAVLVATLAAGGAPARAPAQLAGFEVGARAGTVGLGVEGGVRFGQAAFRAGYGLLPFSIDATDFYDIDGVASAKLRLPRHWYTVGADFYLGGFFRVGGGVLFKPGDVSADVVLEPTAAVELGGRLYTAGRVREISGTHRSRNEAFFALIGFGTRAPVGFGVSLDLGAAFLGDARVDLEAAGEAGLSESEEFRRHLDLEEDNIADRAATYLKYWPIASVTVRFGFGG